MLPPEDSAGLQGVAMGPFGPPPPPPPPLKIGQGQKSKPEKAGKKDKISFKKSKKVYVKKAKGGEEELDDKAKKEDSITPEKKSDYEKTFDDPMPESDGGTGANQSKAS